MVTLYLNKLVADFSVGASAILMTRRNFDQPESDLRRWPTITVRAGDAATLDGHGIVPDLWVRCSPVLSSDGEVVNGNRPIPGDIITGADAQWIPYSGTFDATTGDWIPWRTQVGNLSWTAPILQAPVLDEISYRMGREIITTPRARFSGGQHLISDFGNGTYDAVAWTMSMVILPEPGGDIGYSLLDWGVPGYDPEIHTPPPGRTWVHMEEFFEFGWGTARGVVDPVVPLTRLRPAFVTIVVNPPTVGLTVSAGADFSFRSVATGSMSPVSTPLQFFIGRTVDHSNPPDFSLLEVNFWNRALTDAQVVTLNSNYASIYGAAHEWQS